MTGGSDHLDVFTLPGKAAVVTGAASGIGRAAAVVLAEAGAAVVLADVDAAGLAVTAEAVRARGGRAAVVPTDVTDAAQVTALAEHAVAEHGRIDVWANVAGVIRSAPVVDTTEETLDLIIGVNLKGTYFGCQAAARVMTAQGSGAIVNVASAGADMPAPGISAYALTKAAVLMLTRTLAVEVGPAGVRVNSVAPGFIDTPMVQGYWTAPDGSVDQDARTRTIGNRAAQAPLGVIGEPRDIALAILYLASDAARFITGQTVRPNGGVVMP
ncbi:SDR family oxidoreductase [Streptomycetaceae bacterium NBC_01309]